jgi:hypothetical protein
VDGVVHVIFDDAAAGAEATSGAEATAGATLGATAAGSGLSAKTGALDGKERCATGILSVRITEACCYDLYGVAERWLSRDE